ncbi:MAG: hypothetical protein M1814_000989 [Vezdaea aestivalis]|nr:MAG: hypothetical protein M1814_000989 [Vezdaea aestivalis]
MAEPLSIVASIVGIGLAATQLSQGIYGLISTMRGAQSEMQTIAIDLTCFSAVVDELAEQLSAPHRIYSNEMAKSLRKVIGCCRDNFKEIKVMVKKEKACRAKKGLQFGFLWIFRGPKMRKITALLNSLKLTLSVFLQTLKLAGKKGPKIDRVDDLKRDVLEGLVAGQLHYSKELQSAELSDIRRPFPTRDAAGQLGIVRGIDTMSSGVMLSVIPHASKEDKKFGPLPSYPRPRSRSERRRENSRLSSHYQPTVGEEDDDDYSSESSRLSPILTPIVKPVNPEFTVDRLLQTWTIAPAQRNVQPSLSESFDTKGEDVKAEVDDLKWFNAPLKPAEEAQVYEEVDDILEGDEFPPRRDEFDPFLDDELPADGTRYRPERIDPEFPRRHSPRPRVFDPLPRPPRIWSVWDESGGSWMDNDMKPISWRKESIGGHDIYVNGNQTFAVHLLPDHLCDRHTAKIRRTALPRHSVDLKAVEALGHKFSDDGKGWLCIDADLAPIYRQKSGIVSYLDNECLNALQAGNQMIPKKEAKKETGNEAREKEGKD